MFTASPGAIVAVAAALSSVVYWLDTLTDEPKEDVTSWGQRPEVQAAQPLALAAPVPSLTPQIPVAKIATNPAPKPTKSQRQAAQPQA